MSQPTDLVRELARLEQHFNDRVEVWRVVINADGKEIRRIYRCSFYRRRGTEPPRREEP